MLTREQKIFKTIMFYPCDRNNNRDLKTNKKNLNKNKTKKSDKLQFNKIK